MQYGVYIDQAAITKAGLAGATDATDWLLVEYLRCWWKTGRGRSTRVDGKAYYWLNYRHTIEQNPLLSFRTKSALSRRLARLQELGVLDLVVDDSGDVFARPGEKLLEVDRHRGVPSGDREGEARPDTVDSTEPEDRTGRGKPVDNARGRCGKALRTRNTRCADATPPLRTRNAIRVPVSENKLGRGNPPPRLHASSQRDPRPARRAGGSRSSPPELRRITPGDLKDPDRLRALEEAGVRAGLWSFDLNVAATEACRVLRHASEGRIRTPGAAWVAARTRGARWGSIDDERRAEGLVLAMKGRATVCDGPDRESAIHEERRRQIAALRASVKGAV